MVKYNSGTVGSNNMRDVLQYCNDNDLGLLGTSGLRLISRFEYPQGLYTHQASSIEAILSGKHTAICTSTASGKSLCFSYPVIPLRSLEAQMPELITEFSESHLKRLRRMNH